MLIRVTIDQLRAGMFVHAMDCSWWQNPFWQSRFRVTGETDIATLREAGIVQFTIDDSKGSGIESGPGEDLGDAPLRLDEPPPVVAAPRRSRPRKIDELARAAEIVARSKLAVTRMFREARMGRAVNPEQVAPLVDEIAESMARDATAMIRVTRLKTKNEYTYLHSVAVCALMINLARALKLDEAETRQLGLAGLLHDIGKMGIPEEVLDKPGALTDDERALVRHHPEQGHALIAGCAGVGPLALDVCLHHHERIDGRGYPFGLKAEEISLAARMGAICDVYDAVTSSRPYKDAWPPAEALQRMLGWEGHLDPALLTTFIASIGIHPLGALVRLASNRLGIVVAANDDPMRPTVRVFYSVPEQCFIAPNEVEAAHYAVVGAEDGPAWFADHWPAVLAFVEDRRLPPANLNPPLKLRTARPDEPAPRQRMTGRICHGGDPARKAPPCRPSRRSQSPFPRCRRSPA